PITNNVGGGWTSLPADAEPSLLFYYLFDDWYSSWRLAIEKQHPYTKRLRRLRADLVRNPELHHIDALLLLARQLATLKRMYETYNLMITRILYRQENAFSMSRLGGVKPILLSPHHHHHHHVDNTRRGSAGSPPPALPLLGDPAILGVPLS